MVPREELTDSELSFLGWHAFGPEDVYDARSLPKEVWRRTIGDEPVSLVLGTKCRASGHRLRTRAGHCAQCDPKKLAFQQRYSAQQYVYIAGSQSVRLIKIGTCRYLGQREGQMRSERYGGARDWEFLFGVRVKNAGAVEDAAYVRLSGHRVSRGYWKDHKPQTGTELLRCSYIQAETALLAAAKDAMVDAPWKNTSRIGCYEWPLEETRPAKRKSTYFRDKLILYRARKAGIDV